MRGIPKRRGTELGDLCVTEVKETQEHRMNPVIPMTVTDETDFQDSHTGVQEEEEGKLE